MEMETHAASWDVHRCEDFGTPVFAVEKSREAREEPSEPRGQERGWDGAKQTHSHTRVKTHADGVFFFLETWEQKGFMCVDVQPLVVVRAALWE